MSWEEIIREIKTIYNMVDRSNKEDIKEIQLIQTGLLKLDKEYLEKKINNFKEKRDEKAN